MSELFWWTVLGLVAGVSFRLLNSLDTWIRRR